MKFRWINCTAEHFFGAEKRRLRRRVGQADLGAVMQRQPAQAALAANLRDGDYVRVLCGSLEHLPEAFARIDPAQPEPNRLVRDHRDSVLDRIVRNLRAASPVPLAALMAHPKLRSRDNPNGSLTR